MPGRARLPLAEALQLLEREVVAGEVQRRVLEDAGVAGGEDEPVAVRPVRVGRVVPHHARGRGRRRAARGPSRCPDGRRSPAARCPSPASGSCRSSASGRRWSRQLLASAVGTAPPERYASARPCADHVRRARGRSSRQPHYPTSMAVLIASSLRKELSGDPLFDGVSFKVERRERLALSGPNGAGKTTLLRALDRRDGAAGRRARVREGHPRRAARPAPAARVGRDVARVRALGRRRPRRARGRAAAARAGDGRRRARAGDDAPLRRGAGPARARGRIPLARPRRCGPARARLHRRRPRARRSRRSPAAS